MVFSTLEISELSEEAENDYCLEFTTSNTKQGILLTEDEARGVGQGLLDAVEDNPSAIDGDSVDEIAEK